jgi:hypothetical protein
LLGLDASKPGQLVLVHVDLLTLAQTSSVESSGQEARSVRVQRLVSRGSPPDAGVDVRVGDSRLPGLSLLQPGDDAVFDRKREISSCPFFLLLFSFSYEYLSPVEQK